MWKITKTNVKKKAGVIKQSVVKLFVFHREAHKLLIWVCGLGFSSSLVPPISAWLTTFSFWKFCIIVQGFPISLNSFYWNAAFLFAFLLEADSLLKKFGWFLTVGLFCYTACKSCEWMDARGFFSDHRKYSVSTVIGNIDSFVYL